MQAVHHVASHLKGALVLSGGICFHWSIYEVNILNVTATINEPAGKITGRPVGVHVDGID